MKKAVRTSFFIILLIATFAVAMFYLAYEKYLSNQRVFFSSGYMIVTSYNDNSEIQSEKIFFNEGAKYNYNYLKEVKFEDVDNQKITIDSSNFIHYNDRSVGFFKKSVIFNFKEIENAIPKYYNIFNDSTLEYFNNSYKVKNIDKDLIFDTFLIKNSDNKFLIYSPSYTIQLNNNTIELSDYIEVSFIDNNIIRIVTEDKTYQTIADEAKINLPNDVSINLSNRYIYLKDESKLNLNDIVVDSEDNIEIIPEENKKEEESSTSTEELSSQKTETKEEVSSSTKDDKYIDKISTIEEDDFKVPTAILNDMRVDIHTAEFSIRITDDNALIYGEMVTTVRNTSNNKIVFSKTHSAGEFSLFYSLENLIPETGYMITVNANYVKNDISYNIDLFQKLFVTNEIGLSVSKNYYTDSSLSFNVDISNNKSIDSFDMVLINPNNSEDTFKKTINVSELESTKGIVFDELPSNTKYILRVSNVVYSNKVVADGYSIELEAKTLKSKPVLGKPVVSINKRTSEFEVRLAGIEDIENSIQKYTYEVFDATSLNIDEPPVYSIEKSDVSTVGIKVDGIKLIKENAYAFKVTALAYDNEKYVEYYSILSDVFSMSGRNFPTLSWKEEEITFEKISGVLTINDTDSIIDLSHSVKIVYTNNSLPKSGGEYYGASGTLVLPFEKNNLKANETYSISVYATMDLQDGNGPRVDQYVGSVIVKTKEPRTIYVEHENDESQMSHAFYIKAQFKSCSLKNCQNAESFLEADVMEKFYISLYAGTDTNTESMITIPFVDYDENDYSSDLRKNHYDKEFYITPETFGYTNKRFSSATYTIVIENAIDYTDANNLLPLENNIIRFAGSGGLPDLPSKPDDAISVNVIYNKDADATHYDELLDPETIVGFRVKTKQSIDVATSKTVKVFYHLYNAISGERLEGYDREDTYDETTRSFNEVYYYFKKGDYGNKFTLDENGNVVIDNDLRRGNIYYFTNDFKFIDKNTGNETNWPADNTILSSKKVLAPKQNAKVIFLPMESTTNSYAFNYKYFDIDNILNDSKVRITNGTSTSEMKLIKSDNQDDWKEITANQLVSGNINITGVERYINIYDENSENSCIQFTYNSCIESVEYVNQEFLPESSLSDVRYKVLKDSTNKLIVQFDPSDDLSRISSLSAKFTCNDETITVDDVFLKGESATVGYVSLYKLREFLGKDVDLVLSANYDSNAMGFGFLANPENYFLPAFVDENTGKIIYAKVSNDKFDKSNISSNYANGIMFSAKENDNNYVFTDKYNPSISVVLDKYTLKNNVKVYNYASDGLVHNNYIFIPKRIEKIDLTNLETNSIHYSFAFLELKPGVSIKDNMGVNRILTTLNSMSVKISLGGFDAEDEFVSIKNNKIKLRLYDAVTNEQLFDDFILDANDLEDYQTIEGLSPKTSYYFKLFADVKYQGDSSYNETQLYDLNEESAKVKYAFNTKEGVEISKIRHTYEATNYDNKEIKFTYDVDLIVGYKRIRYELFEEGSDIKLDIDIPETTPSSTSLSTTIVCNKENGCLDFGKKYVLRIITVVEKDGNTKDLNYEDYHFSLNLLRTPIVKIYKYLDNSENLGIKVSIQDYDKVIVNSKYRFKVYNDKNEDVTKSALNVENLPSDYDISVLGKVFYLPGIDSGKNYRIIVSADLDMNNDFDETKYSSYTNDLDIETDMRRDFSLGNVYLSNILGGLSLTFIDSYNLGNAKRLVYSLNKYGDEVSTSGSVDFIPIQSNSTQNEYYYEIGCGDLLEKGLYYLQVQLFDENNELLDEQTYEHYNTNKELGE